MPDDGRGLHHTHGLGLFCNLFRAHESFMEDAFTGLSSIVILDLK